MAIDRGTNTVTTNKRDRNYRVDIFIADDDSQQMRFYRETISKDTTTNEIVARDRNLPPVERTTDQIKTKSYTAGGVTATGQQILQLLNRISDDERQIDIAESLKSRFWAPNFFTIGEPAIGAPELTVVA